MREKATKSHIGEGKAGDILRRRIQRLAAGKFEQEQPVLSLSEEKIEIEVLEGQDYTGEFVIEVSNHVPVKMCIRDRGQWNCGNFIHVIGKFHISLIHHDKDIILLADI